MEGNIYTVDYILENELDKKAYGFIYITMNLINSKKYIGQRNFKRKGWQWYLGSGKLIQKAIKKYGRNNFVRNIIYISYSQNESNKLEKDLIQNYNADKSINYYNIAEGGYGNPFSGKSEEEINLWKHKLRLSHINPSEETRKKMSESQKGLHSGINNYWYGRKLTNEQKNKRSLDKQGKNHPNWGKHLTEETRTKISKSNKGKIISNEQKKKISEANKGKPSPMLGRYGELNHRSKKTICTTTGEIYGSAREASRKTNIQSSTIINCCNGKQKSAGKHPDTGEPLKWMYYEDYIAQHNEQNIIQEQIEIQEAI